VPGERVKIAAVKTFEFDDGSAEEFVKRVRDALAERGLAEYVDVNRDGGELVVGFRWMGSSELRYRLSENERGFRADLAGERMSPFHAPFRQKFEDQFQTVVGSVGARVV
jgi:hypothetical protein